MTQTWTETGEEEGPAFDWWRTLSDSAFLETPYHTLHRLRARGSVQYDPQSGIYFVLGHEAFARIVKSSKMGRDTRAWVDGWTDPDYRKRDPVGYALFSEFRPQMINVDGAEHRRMRKVYEPAFRSQAMAVVEPLVRAQAERLIAALPAEGEADLIEGFAAPLPLRVLCELFAIDESLDQTIGAWSASLIRIGDILMTPEQKREALDALHAFKAFLRERMADGAYEGTQNLMALAIRAHADGTLDEEETLTNLVSMLVAGHETTVTLIGNGMLLLLREPEQMARLRAEPALIRTGIEEFMRLEPGGNMILRVALEHMEVAGVTIPKGAPVIGLIGAINRDPARFRRPDELDVGRPSNAHFTFGGGAHVCIGAPLARLEARIAFAALLEAFESIELAGTPEWRLDRMNARGLARLPVRLRVKR